MKTILAACGAVLAVVLQGTLLYRALPGGITPDITLLLTLWVSWRSGSTQGAIIGLWCGALVGAAAGNLAVGMALLYGLAGWASGLLAAIRPRNAYLRSLLLGAAMAVAVQGLQIPIYILAGFPMPLDPYSIPWTMLWHALGLFLLVCGGTLRVRWPKRRARPHVGGKKLWTADSAWLASAV